MNAKQVFKIAKESKSWYYFSARIAWLMFQRPSTEDCSELVERLELADPSTQKNEFVIPAVSVAKLPLPRPLEAWSEARRLDLGDYIEWHLEQERRGNAR